MNKEKRIGKATASRFGDVMAGKSTKRYQQYQREIVLELSGAPVFEDDAPWFGHGKENEAEGRGAYEFQTGREVYADEDLYVPHPTLEFVGCSPDGLVGDDGGIEIKSRSSLKSHHKSVDLGIDSVYKPQVQGCLMCTGREWWDFVSFYVPVNRFEPGAYTDLHIHRVYPDVAYINKLETRLKEFWEEVQQQLNERNNG